MGKTFRQFDSLSDSKIKSVSNILPFLHPPIPSPGGRGVPNWIGNWQAETANLDLMPIVFQNKFFRFLDQPVVAGNYRRALMQGLGCYIEQVLTAV